MTDDSGSPSHGKAERRYGESRVESAADRNVKSACIDSSEHEHIGSEEGHDEPSDAIVYRLLVGYGEALDSIAAKPSVVFLPHRSVPRWWAWPCVILPRANRIAAILAEAHVAARLDALLRRGHRFRAFDPRGPSPLDLDRLQDFRDSLSPVRWRTLALWVILLALAVAFPVAWITDYLRVLIPKVIVCSSKFSVRSFIDRPSFQPQRVSIGCSVHHAGASLMKTLQRVAHINLSPGSVIDTVLSVRASGLLVLLLLTVVMILSLCVVLLVFRSGFQLKRRAFSIPQETSDDHESLLRSGIRSGGLYALERDTFTAVGLRCPREFPLDLAVSAGLLAFPLTITVYLFIAAALPKLDARTRTLLAVVAVGFIVVVLLQLQELVQVWRSRIGLKVIEPRKRWLPNGSTVLVCSGAYGAILLAACCIALDLLYAERPYQTLLAWVLIPLLVAPALAWPFSMHWWYRMHHELAAYARLRDRPSFRAPMLSVVPLLILAVVGIFLITQLYVDNNFFRSDDTWGIAFLLFLTGLIGALVGIYRMAWRLEQLRCQAGPHAAWRTIAVSLGATAMFSLNVGVILYFQRSLNRIWREIGIHEPGQD